MDCPVDVQRALRTKFGPEFSDEGDDLVIVSETEGTIDIGWYLYEFIALGLPMQHRHEDGGCNEAMMRALEAHRVDDAGEEDEAD